MFKYLKKQSCFCFKEIKTMKILNKKAFLEINA